MNNNYELYLASIAAMRQSYLQNKNRQAAAKFVVTNVAAPAIQFSLGDNNDVAKFVDDCLAKKITAIKLHKLTASQKDDAIKVFADFLSKNSVEQFAVAISTDAAAKPAPLKNYLAINYQF